MSFSDALRGIREAADEAGEAPPETTRRPVERPPEPRPLTVTQACERVSEALEQIENGDVFQVEGEVGDCSVRDHWYFTLKDAEGSKLSCAFFSFRRRADRGAEEPQVGMRMVVTGRPELYHKAGRLSFVVTRLRRAGQGDLHQRFEALKTELRERGWFDPSRRIPLPSFARRLLILTSSEAAALKDVVETARRRWPGMELLLAPIPVQGDRATPVIADAIRQARRQAPGLGVDAIVLTRGGGSLEDLWCFNEEKVATAIHESRTEAVDLHRGGGPSPVPLVAAIGHESDISIAELVADHRASTPTQAAMELVPDASEQEEYLDGRRMRLELLVGRTLDRARARVDLASRHEVIRRPQRMLEPHRRRLEDARGALIRSLEKTMQQADRRLERATAGLLAMSPARRLADETTRLGHARTALHRSMATRLQAERVRLDHLAETLRVMGPDSVLARGYALVLDERGKPVRKAENLQPGDRLSARFQKGAATLQVESTRNDEVESPT